jgi:hypothetical protein
MTNQKADKLRKLLQSAVMNKPSSSFTEEVMKTIQSEVTINPLLKSILENTPLKGPSENFTYGVMSRLEVSDFKIADESIISKKVWLMVSGLVVLLVLVALSGRQENNPSVSSYFNEVKYSLQLILTYLNAIPAISVICLISVGAVLLLDYFLKEKLLRFKKV